MSFFSVNNKSLTYAFRILVGSVIVWWTLDYMHDSRRIWALISVIVVTETDTDLIKQATISRGINTIIGCLIGLAFMYTIGNDFFSLMAAITLSVIISTSFKNYPASWKLSPATVAIIMVPSASIQVSWHDAMMVSLERTGEVLYGSVIALVLAIVLTAIKRKYLSTIALTEKQITHHDTSVKSNDNDAAN